MRYAILPYPHANRRYLEAIRPLLLSEAALLAGEGCEPFYESVNGLELLCLDAPASPRLEERLRLASGSMALFALDVDALRPLMNAPHSPFEDAAHILKYKGKTNERFTALLLNLAVFSSDFANDYDERLSIADPMCGRGTALFGALARGYDALGVENDRKELREAETFFKRYLEYHRFKHTLEHDKPQMAGKTAGERATFTTGADPASFKARPQRLSMVWGDCTRLVAYAGKRGLHAITADLPYGIQHSAKGSGTKGLEPLLKNALPAWRDALKPGGAVAVSFNQNTLTLERARELMSEAGLTPLEGRFYDHLDHWVEQAVTRNAAVGIYR